VTRALSAQIAETISEHGSQ